MNEETPHLRFDFPGDSGMSERIELIRPVKVFVAHSVTEVIPALEMVQAALKPGYLAAGFLSYEAAPAFDSALEVAPASDLPLLWFGIFERPSAPPLSPIASRQPCAPDAEWVANVSEAEYLENIDKIKTALSAGESYQVNYSLRLRSKFERDAFEFYERLRANQLSSYCAFLDIGRFQILSSSPELFFEKRGDFIRTKPMKGTIRRGRWLKEDEAQKSELLASEKNRAENLMIVDLLRNDLGRIAITGTVTVENLFEVETYPTLHTLTSTISAKLRPSASLTDIFKTLFPCGSVTGAPKISTMRLIRDLEGEPRQIYCGAIGLISPERAIFSVPIRTALIDKERRSAEYGVGGGVTWDSIPKEEYAEALLKSKALTTSRPEFELTEALALQKVFFLLERHLRRLENSARYFGFPFDTLKALCALSNEADSLAPQSELTTFKIRLSLSKEGTLRTESVPIERSNGAIQKIALAEKPVDSSDIFLFHKTTNRAVYENLTIKNSDFYDTLLWNERQELTEFTRGNVVLRMDGVDWTPPIECGLLGGTYREELLESGTIQERVLTIADLAKAEELFFINSVRGRVKVKIGEER